jgi:oligosaccharide repeat unit polymerase
MIYGVPAELLFSIGLASLLTWMIGFYVLIIKCKVPIYHPAAMLLGYHFIGFVVRPFVIYSTGYSQIWEYIGYFPSSEDIIYSALIANSYFLAFAGGVYFIAGVFDRGFGGVVYNSGVTISGDRLNWFYAFYGVLIVVGFLAFYSTSGDISHKLNGGGARGVVGASGGIESEKSGYISLLADNLVILIIIGLSCVELRRYVVALTIFYVIYKMSMGGGRSSFIAIFLGGAYVYLTIKNKKYFSIYIVGFGSFLMLIFDLIGSYREAIFDLIMGRVNFETVVERYYDSRGGSGFTSDFSEFDVVSSIVGVVPDLSGWSMGSQYLRLFVWPIPRFIWPSKPIFTNIIDFQEYGNFFGLTYSIYSDSYMSFGFLFGFVCMFFIGYFSSIFYRKVLLSRSPLLFFMYVPFICYIPILFRDGPVSFLYFFLVNLLPIYLLNKVAKFKFVY